MFEVDLQAVINPLVANRCWWGKLPQGVDLKAGPTVLLKQYGGKPGQYVEKDNLPDHKHARVYVTVIGDSYNTVAPLIRSISDAILMSAFVAEADGEPEFDEDDRYQLTLMTQVFGIWFLK